MKVITSIVIALSILGADAKPLREVPEIGLPLTMTAQPSEDSPEFDCRIHGNRICGNAFYDGLFVSQVFPDF